jgi:hypothetical protein
MNCSALNTFLALFEWTSNLASCVVVFLAKEHFLNSPEIESNGMHLIEKINALIYHLYNGQVAGYQK